MSGVETATHAGVYWAVALSIAVLVGAVIALSWRRARERRMARLEHERLMRDIAALQARIEGQRSELESTNAQLADQAQRLVRQADTLAAANRDIEACAADLLRTNERH